jgi:protein-S-isoprenylcysteine O-methyltransferase Ste14
MSGEFRSRIAPITGAVIFLFVAPGVVAGLIPYWISGWQVGSPLGGIELLRWLGVLLLLPGGVLLAETFARFALQGRGTPAPVYPTETLVVTGSYRFVRNPMYVAVVSLILGQGLLFGNLAVLAYGAAIWLIVHLFVIGYEEPTLREQFPDDYPTFAAGVPRWVPRLTPWRAA